MLRELLCVARGVAAPDLGKCQRVAGVADHGNFGSCWQSCHDHEPPSNSTNRYRRGEFITSKDSTFPASISRLILFLTF